ncbi:MAG: insulinase family protein [Pirellulales bacterium]
MKRLLFLCCALLSPASLFAAEPASQSAPSKDRPEAVRRWAHEMSDLKPDERVVWGKLDNGLRYAILPTKSAPTRGSLRMLVLAGSVMETDEQQGVAHFLEHMAFNGTKHFKAGDTFEYFQRLGMSFGAHTNAMTYVDHTVYQLELPRANQELTNDGLKLFRDFLDGMLLDEKEIDRERGVILSEQTAGNSAQYRSSVGMLQAALTGTKFAARMPIGKTETIRGMTRKHFVDFYETWYTPGRTVIVATGDFDAAMVEREIRNHFADAKAAHGETADPEVGKLQVDRGPTARFHRVADTGRAIVCLTRLKPADTAVEDMAKQRRDLVDLLVERMIDQRLEKLTNAKDSVVPAASMNEERLYNACERHVVAAQCLPQHWKAAVGMLEQELRRALIHGFTEAELRDAKAYLAGAFEVVVDQAETKQPNSLADQIVESICDLTVFSHPSLYKDLVQTYVPTITANDCRRALKNDWRGDEIEISLTGNIDLDASADEQLLAAYRSSRDVTVNPPVDEDAPKFAYTDFGPEGKIVKRDAVDDLGVVQATFANNVRVNIKHTDFEKNKVRVLFRFGGGDLELPADKPGLQLFATQAFIAGGLKGLSLDALNRQLSGKNVGVVFTVGDDAFELRGACTKSELELQMQLCAAYLTAAGFAPETAGQFAEMMDATYAQQARSLEGKFRYDAAAFLRSNDHRYMLPSREAVSRLTLADVQQWLAEPLANGYLEITLVGDVDVDTALAVVAKTAGALPQRAAEKPAFAAARKLQFPTEKVKHLQYEADTPRAASAVCWPTAGSADLDLQRRLYVLSLVLDERLRLKIREELGATYTPNVLAYSSDTYPEFGFIGAQMLVEPQQLDEIGRLTTKVADEIASGTISDDEFARVIKPVISSVEPQQRDNGYWLTSLGDSQERPRALDEVRTLAAAYSSMTKMEIESIAKQYLTAAHATVVKIAPSSGAAVEAKESTAAR